MEKYIQCLNVIALANATIMLMFSMFSCYKCISLLRWARREGSEHAKFFKTMIHPWKSYNVGCYTLNRYAIDFICLGSYVLMGTSIFLLQLARTFTVAMQMGQADQKNLDPSCYIIDGFDVIIDPFGDPDCLKPQDKLILGLLGASVLFSLPVFNLILLIMYPVFWILGKLVPQFIFSVHKHLDHIQEDMSEQKVKIEELKKVLYKQ